MTYWWDTSKQWEKGFPAISQIYTLLFWRDFAAMHINIHFVRRAVSAFPGASLWPRFRGLGIIERMALPLFDVIIFRLFRHAGFCFLTVTHKNSHAVVRVIVKDKPNIYAFFCSTQNNSKNRNFNYKIIHILDQFLFQDNVIFGYLFVWSYLFVFKEWKILWLRTTIFESFAGKSFANISIMLIEVMAQKMTYFILRFMTWCTIILEMCFSNFLFWQTE